MINEKYYYLLDQQKQINEQMQDLQQIFDKYINNLSQGYFIKLFDQYQIKYYEFNEQINKYKEELIDNYKKQCKELQDIKINEAFDYIQKWKEQVKQKNTCLSASNQSKLLIILKESQNINLVTDDIPEYIKQLYDQKHYLFQFNEILNEISNKYNYGIKYLREEELILVEQEYNKIREIISNTDIDAQLNLQTIQQLQEQLQTPIDTLYVKSLKIKETRDQISQLLDQQTYMQMWQKQSKYVQGIEQLIDQVTQKLTTIQQNWITIQKINDQIYINKNKIQLLLQETKEICQPQEDQWNQYLQMIHNTIKNILKQIIIKNLQYLYDQLALNKSWYVIDVIINFSSQKLEVKQMSLENQFNLLIQSIYQIVDICYNPLQNQKYRSLIDEQEIQQNYKQIQQISRQAENKIENLINLIQNYQFLLKLDIQQFLQDFINNCGDIKSGVTQIKKSEESIPAQADDFIKQINFIDQLIAGLTNEIPQETEIDYLYINLYLVTEQLTDVLMQWRTSLIQYLQSYIDQKCNELNQLYMLAQQKLQMEHINNDEFYETKKILIDINKIALSFDQEKEKLKQIGLALDRLGEGQTKINYIDQVTGDIDNIIEQARDINQIIQPVEKQVYDQYTSQETELCENIQKLSDNWLPQQNNQFVVEQLSNVQFSDMKEFYDVMDQANIKCEQYKKQIEELLDQQQYFTIYIHSSYKLQQAQQQIKQIQKQLIEFKQLVDSNSVLNSIYNYYLQQQYTQIDYNQLQMYIQQIQKQVIHLARNYQLYRNMTSSINIINEYIPIIINIQNQSLRYRHKVQINNLCGIDLYEEPYMKMSQLIESNIGQQGEEINQIVIQAQKELNQETILQQLNSDFILLKLEFQDIYFIIPHETIKQLDNMQQQIQQLSNSPLQTFKQEIQMFQDKLIFIEQVLNIWAENQQKIKNLSPLILQSKEVQQKLPEITKQFNYVYNTWKENIEEAKYHKMLYELAVWTQQLQIQEEINDQLSIIEKHIQKYLDTKRSAFPRFSFISSNDLLEILANQNNPKQIEKHISKLFEDIKEINIENNKIVGITSKDGEILKFQNQIDYQVEAEQWLKQIQQEVKLSLVDLLNKSISSINNGNYEQWIENTNGQIANLTVQILFTNLVESAFLNIQQNQENAMKNVLGQIDQILNIFITILQRQISQQLNKKLVGVCTLLINQKDIVQDLIDNNITSNRDFKWISNLRYMFSPDTNEILVKICDTTFKYGFEPIGIPSWLVMTKLTSKCYITISQSLQLHYFTSAQGPAGTGKTETTKDIAKKLGKMCFVYNCSPEMTGSSIQQILKGAEESKTWLCFDEFNRISAEVLSVVATYVKQMLEKQRKIQKQYIQEAAVIITMNPGYAGRTELPDNLKSLFRSVSMVVPDFTQITEIMLTSNGFVNSRELAKKFVKLYELNKELLSKQDHYDWGLRAIIAICRQAGELRRKMIQQKEDE